MPRSGRQEISSVPGWKALGTAAASDVEAFASAKSVAGLIPLRRALDAAHRSVAVAVLGDSTGNDSTEWIHKFAEYLASAYPTWTVQHRAWSDTTQDYAAPTTLQTGTAGALYLDTTTGTATRRLDPTVTPHFTGTIDARFKVSLNSWVPTTQVNIGGRSGASGSRSWYLLLNTFGYPYFAYSTDGANISTIAATAATGIANGSTAWVRCVFTPDDGAGNRVARFYTSTNGTGWTQIGATVTQAGAVTLFEPTNWGATIGGTGGASPAAAEGLRVYEVQFRDGENGPNRVPAMPDLWAPYSSDAAQFVGAPVLTVLSGSHGGASLAYLTDSTRLEKLTPDYGQRVVLVSSSHNEGLNQGQAWVNTLENAHAVISARSPAPLVFVTQNPETAAATWRREHAQRRLDTLAWAQSKNISVLDTYQAFLDYGAWEADLMADSVHPNAAGQQVWTDAVTAAFDATR